MKKTILLVAAMCGLCCCPGQAQLLKGVVKADSISDMMVTFSPSGNIFENVNAEVGPDANGVFVYDGKIGRQWIDATVQADNDVFGVHLEQGKKATISITRDSQGQLTATLGGDNAQLSNVVNTITKAYDMMRYWSPDPAEAKPISEYRAQLEQEHARVDAVLKKMKKGPWRDYYTRLSEGSYRWMCIRLLMDQAFDENKSFLSYPEYVEATRDIDPNDSINLLTNLSTAWQTSTRLRILSETNDTTASYLQLMREMDTRLTNSKARRLLTQMLMYSYTMGPEGDIEKIWAAYKDFAKDYPEMIAQYEPMIKTALQTFNGKPLPYDPTIETVAGDTLKLSRLYGKITYIDMWATWCGPCCKEIPHLKKVLEKNKGNDKIAFVSISIDANRKAWENKLKKDNPQWPQYLMPQADADKLMKLMGINGIPRFILLDAKGNVIDPDAKRPSDPELQSTIDKLTK